MAYITYICLYCCLALTFNQALAIDGIPHIIPHFNTSELGLPEIPNFGLPLNPLSFFSSFLGGRKKRQAETTTNGMNEEETQGDIPISRYPTFVYCNGTSQVTSSCLNCRQVLVCARNVGIVRSCLGQQRFCHEGQCTTEQPSDCANVQF